MSFVILTDSTSDLGADLREKYDIEYVPMNYCIGENEYKASLDWESHSPSVFYDKMRHGERITTTQVPRGVFESAFRKYAEEGKDVLYIACSSALSGSVNLAKSVASDVLADHPERIILCVDSLISSLGEGCLAIKASMLRSDGKEINEVADYINENKLKVNQFGTVDDLGYLRRAGRVKASKAFFGNLFGVKPILISDIKGQNFAVKKAKGALNARREIALGLKETVVDPENQTLFISHADSLEFANMLRDEIMKEIPFKDCYINYIAPIVGASVGPGTLIAFCVGKEVTVEGVE